MCAGWNALDLLAWLLRLLLLSQQRAIQVEFSNRYHFHVRVHLRKVRQKLFCVADDYDTRPLRPEPISGEPLNVGSCNGLQVGDIAIDFVKTNTIQRQRADL